jgi:ATP-dependent Lhr-like helicase
MSVLPPSPGTGKAITPKAQSLRQKIVESVFSSLHESLRQVIARRPGWTELREVQEQSYAAVAAGNDVLVIAPTAGGKSEAALLPVMDDLLKHGRPGVACLYLSPLKALINDQEERFSAFCTPVSLSVMKWHGDVPKGDRSWKGEPPHFLMITPESLEVLLQEPVLAADLKHARFIIVDELHAFVETARGVHLRVLLDRLDRIAGRKIQRIGLSATAGNPAEILDWLSGDRHGSALVAVPSPPREKHFSFLVEPEEHKRVDAVAGIVAGRKALVFVNSRSGAESLAAALQGRVRNLHIHHSSLATEIRRAAEDAFLSEDGACIICTSTLELGIDIGDLDVVVQAGPPDSVSSFLQRMGRSGRRGRPAYVAWVLKDPRELLCSCAIIECAMDRRVEKLYPPERPYHVLVQQLFLSLHRQQRAGRRKLVAGLLESPAFAGITATDLDRLLRHLAAEGYITADGEILMPGTEAERVLGRSNWKDLYSVINGGGEYRAMTPEGEVVGKLDARFVNSLEAGAVTLGGRTWTVVGQDEGHDIVVVVPDGAGTARTFWTGSGEGGFSSLICERAGRIRERGKSILPLGESERGMLGIALAGIPEGVSGKGLYVQEGRRHGRRAVTVWSLHGSRFNRVLALLLRPALGKKARVRFADFFLEATGAGKEGAAARVASALASVRALSREEIGALLSAPPRDGWKFGALLPDDLFAACSIPDYYHLAEYREIIGTLEIAVLPEPVAEPVQVPDDDEVEDATISRHF